MEFKKLESAVKNWTYPVHVTLAVLISAPTEVIRLAIKRRLLLQFDKIHQKYILALAISC